MNLLETTLSIVAIQVVRLWVCPVGKWRAFDFRTELSNVIDNVTIGDKQVQVRIVVVIHPVGTERHKQQTGLSKSSGKAGVNETALAKVPVQSIRLQG